MTTPTPAFASAAADLLYSDVEEQLRASVRDLLATRSPVAAVITRTESSEPYDPALWRALAIDIGVTALAVPVQHGGHGASWREVAVVAEELGASVAPTPFLGHTMATVAARIAGASDLIPQLVSGERTGALAVSAVPFGTDVDVRDGVLVGTVRGVIDAVSADVFLVPTSMGMHAVEADQVTATRITSLDMTRPLCDLTFDGATAHQLSAPRPGAHDGALLIGG
ncbi:MAG: hypothetical protein QOG80_450, partial [Pseudonocardiales bacterium]|nr:hypothetical protein [Pseudonocardiales bacterium]